ncbi:hypothetical protein [Conchiformibius steedae]|uniref:Uncharacterized protein n=1 Tax=Conchiformibius steedae TaxID=153493 RepID=A0A3P2A913_9NEIS|nr:hypothetical protein [Conchiformibius steedae]RRD90103.1 hypothetical protein EII21_06710 [Conchiformibius steedae]
MITVFTLTRNRTPIGQIHWETKQMGVFPIANSGKIYGDETAVKALNALVERAFSEKWKNILPPNPNLNELSDPLTSPSELFSMFIHGGYDIPPELQQMYDKLCGNIDTGGIDVDF